MFLETLISKYDFWLIKLPGLSRNGPQFASRKNPSGKTLQVDWKVNFEPILHVFFLGLQTEQYLIL